MKKKTREQKLKDKGFNFIKIELEADFNTAGQYCQNCDEGYVTCPDCDGEGCEECDYQEVIECPDCNGQYTGTRLRMDEVQRVFKRNLPRKVRDNLAYIRAYRDGSVDTEITLTYPVKYADLTPDVLEAFNATASHFNREIGVRNAGLHIAVSSTSNPSDSSLDSGAMKNFYKQIPKLMAGMYLIASGQEWTRSFEFRLPKVSRSEKYSAIYTHGDRYLEYRIFDTCYHDCKMVLDFIDMIIGTLKYYDAKAAPRLDNHLVTGMNMDKKLKDSFINEESKKRAIREMGYFLSKGRVNKHMDKLKMTKEN